MVKSTTLGVGGDGTALEKVRAELSLTALAYNLRRVLNIVGLPDLIAALEA